MRYTVQPAIACREGEHKTECCNKVSKCCICEITMNKADILFDKIKTFVDSGKDINSFYEDSSVVYEFLETYYQQVVYSPGAHHSTDDGSDDYAKELLLPLEERPNNIARQIHWFMDHGADMNDGGDYPPLIPPVAFLDYAMVELLLANGANAQFDMSEDGEIPCGCGNYYIDDLDVTMLNCGREPKIREILFDRVLKIVSLFAKYGVTDVHTHCISIDGKTRTISVTQAQVKY